ncbi:hypothetical protein CONCODRAFT_6240 [Conidiobolus coronatus NRRL 28638]|uniref:G-protein coupled receptors family 1 profile domain-containing protein n=1 Tax=Conidiobolus coronatus (strain ATCC 28846 / CBS 209.66 / NRRL 28638) TaxID=796925 RepID=A0A137P7Y9_CONC2|nr:hypothetical protein CONCODRAFT_6240 [Conidiobolus coronatus NRRL 28638]|eukprot:KXN71137.1 hypothetical protein CONCODRAFT_6240 [Conidiobolus coronatus NRRL 28638]
MSKPVFCSLIALAFGVCMAVFADPKENQGLTYCALNVEANYISFPMELFITIMTFFYLLLMIFCYYHISIYYYNTIQMMELNAKALNKIIQAEFNTSVRENCDEREVEGKSSTNTINTTNTKVEDDNSSIYTSGIKSLNSNTTKKCKIMCLAYRLISLIKVQSMILIFLIELLPITVLHFLKYLIKIPHYLVIEVISYYLVEFLSITNPAMVLFLHEETFQEFKFLCLLIKLRIKRVFVGSR